MTSVPPLMLPQFGWILDTAGPSVDLECQLDLMVQFEYNPFQYHIEKRTNINL